MSDCPHQAQLAGRPCHVSVCPRTRPVVMPGLGTLHRLLSLLLLLLSPFPTAHLGVNPWPLPLCPAPQMSPAAARSQISTSV